MRRLAAGILLSMALPGGAMELVETSGALTLRDGGRDVFAFQTADKLQEGVDPKYTRSCYIHPLYAPNGEMLTEDFPTDHYHHRGVFWSWAVVNVRGVKTQNWHPANPPLRHQFVRWIKQTAGETSAILIAEIDWILDTKEKVAREQVTIETAQARNDRRTLDITIELEAVGGPLALAGTPEGNKGYGGFCFRGASGLKGAKMSSDEGREEKDLENQSRKWINLSGPKSGVAIFVPKDHPGYPPAWLARSSYAGFLNVSWPGLREEVLQPGEPVTLRYRMLIHDGTLSADDLAAAYKEYAAGK